MNDINIVVVDIHSPFIFLQGEGLGSLSEIDDLASVFSKVIFVLEILDIWGYNFKKHLKHYCERWNCGWKQYDELGLQRF